MVRAENVRMVNLQMPDALYQMAMGACEEMSGPAGKVTLSSLIRMALVDFLGRRESMPLRVSKAMRMSSLQDAIDVLSRWDGYGDLTDAIEERRQELEDELTNCGEEEIEIEEHIEREVEKRLDVEVEKRLDKAIEEARERWEEELEGSGE